MIIQWVQDNEESVYWDLMIDRKPKPYPEFNKHVLCEINEDCTCDLNEEELDCE
jgi:hypothetical protein